MIISGILKILEVIDSKNQKVTKQAKVMCQFNKVKVLVPVEKI